jgi:tetratricopeptide (TPR) repeat protein
VPPAARPVAVRPAPSRPPPAPVAAVRPPPPPPPVEDLSSEIEEADFFLQQGLVDDARDALQALVAAHPGHPELTRKLAEIEARAARAAPSPARPAAGRSAPSAPAPPAATPAAPAADESFDIARELAQELGASAPSPAADEFQYSVEDVFSQFKKGVEKTVRPEDSDTHYDLGIAYKEMGLLDDAIHEFEVALSGKNRKKEVDCLTMVGLCRSAKGEPDEAIQAFRRALQSDRCTPEASKALQFELAAAWEQKGDPDCALHYLHRVAAADGAYRDVKARIAALGGGPGRPPPGEAEGQGARTPGPARKNIGYI